MNVESDLDLQLAHGTALGMIRTRETRFPLRDEGKPELILGGYSRAAKKFPDWHRSLEESRPGSLRLGELTNVLIPTWMPKSREGGLHSHNQRNARSSNSKTSDQVPTLGHPNATHKSGIRALVAFRELREAW